MGPGLPEQRFFKFGGLIIHLTSLTGGEKWIEWEMVQADMGLACLFGVSTYLQLCKSIYIYGNKIDLDIEILVIG